MDRKNDAAKIIDGLGGTVRVALICDVSAGAVSLWRQRGIPKTHYRWLKSKRPKWFKEQEEQSA